MFFFKIILYLLRLAITGYNIFSLIFIKILKINVAIYILVDILILRDRKNIALTIYRTRYTLSG